MLLTTMDKGPGMKGEGQGSTRLFFAAQSNFRRRDKLVEFPQNISQFPLMTTHNELVLSLSNKNMSRSFSN